MNETKKHELIRDLTAHWDKHRTFQKLKTSNALYMKLYNAAKEAGMQPSEFAQSLGYNYLSRKNETDLIKIHTAKLTAFFEQYGSLDKLYYINVSLYNNLCASAKNRNMSLKEYIAMLGFTYNVRMNRIKELIRDLTAHWDKHRTFQKLHIYDVSLYKRLLLAAKKAKMPPSEFAQSLGFNYLSQANETDLIKIHTDKLKAFIEQYGSLDKLSTLRPSLYDTLTKSAKNRNMSLKEYLAMLGFSYTEKNEIDLIKIHTDKLKAFVEQYGSSLDKLWKINSSLYHNLHVSAKKRKMSLKEYLATLGFSYTERKKRRLIPLNIHVRKSKKRTPYLSRIK